MSCRIPANNIYIVNYINIVKFVYETFYLYKFYIHKSYRTYILNNIFIKRHFVKNFIVLIVFFFLNSIYTDRL